MTAAATPGAGASARWLVAPRWGAALAYLVAWAACELGLIQTMPAWPVLSAAVATVITNLLLLIPQRPVLDAPRIVALLLFDAAQLTLVLYFTGGATNPLSSLFLVPVGLAAMLLGRGWAWSLALLSVAAYGALFLAPTTGQDPAEHGVGLEEHADHAHGAMGRDAPAGNAHRTMALDPRAPAPGAASPTQGNHTSRDGRASQSPFFDLHLQGMWVAYSLTALLMTYFITRISASLRAREEQLGRARTRALRAERVASLASLAGSTAHELGTPLASILLAAGEMQRGLRGETPRDELIADAQLVQDQARRCRQILDSMLQEAGESVGEQPVELSARELVTHAVSSFPGADQARIEYELADDLPALRLPRNVVSQALQNLLRNALQASSAQTPVRLTAEGHGDHIRFRVEDRGVGMSEAEVEQALEPFVTSKPGHGQGLGLFLTRAVAERLGGSLVLDSRQGQGTAAVLELRCEAVTDPSPEKWPGLTTQGRR